jgi:ArsR family transcriptional regulator, arsenate/arsenite/antimonite-responsive transcriptional repressor
MAIKTADHLGPAGAEGLTSCVDCDAAAVVAGREASRAQRLAVVAKALGDPIRLQLVDLLRTHGGTVCVCDLTPLFEVGQPTVSHHLRVLREAGLVDSERRGRWAYYRVLPEGLSEFSAWMHEPESVTRGTTTVSAGARHDEGGRRNDE